LHFEVHELIGANDDSTVIVAIFGLY